MWLTVSSHPVERQARVGMWSLSLRFLAHIYFLIARLTFEYRSERHDSGHSLSD